MTRPLLIAECCQNHNGDFALLERMIDEAAAAGADYVKLQTIYSELLTRRERFEEGESNEDGSPRVIQRPFAAEQARLAGLDLSYELEARFIERCRSAGVKSMTTPFARCVVPRIAELGYDAVKIASYDCGSLPLLEDLLPHFETFVVSTGASTEEEIEAAATLLREAEKTAVFLLCVTLYPTPPEQFHLARMSYLRVHAQRVGLSSHPLTRTHGILGDQIALALDADCIERHFSILEPDQTRDGPVSISPAELSALRTFADLPLDERRRWVREHVADLPRYLGSAARTLSAEELRNRDYYRGRFASPDGQGGWIYNWERRALPTG